MWGLKLKEPKVLFTELQIRERVRELAVEINSVLGRSFVLLSILKGSVVFAVDLMRFLEGEIILDFVRVKSYHGKTKGDVRITYGPELDLEGRRVLVVDDIFDTGESLWIVYSKVASMNPMEVKTCVFLNKEVERNVPIEPDFIGFNVPPCFVVGYGLDLDERYRNLPYVGCFEETLKGRTG